MMVVNVAWTTLVTPLRDAMKILPLFLVCAVGALLSAQQPNVPAAQLLVNGLGTSGPYPISVGLNPSGALGTVLLSTNQTAPVPFILAVGHIAVGAMSFGGQSLDLLPSGCGFAIVLNGFDPLSAFSAMSILSPQFAATVWFPNSFGGPVGLQACVANPTAPQGFTFTAAADLFSGGPALATVAPAMGPTGGGLALVLTGTNFQCDPPLVLIGGVPAPSAVVLSDQIIHCTSPALPAGNHSVTLVQAHGTSTLNAAFTAQVGNPLFTSNEDFNDQSGRDATFQPQFSAALWNDPTQPGLLSGTMLSGSPLASYQGNPANLGTRWQVAVQPTPMWTYGVFSPFDTPTNNLGPGINPAGGSRTMHIYEAVDLGLPRAALELVEWGPFANTVFPAAYPGFTMWCGQTVTSAPWAQPNGTLGMFTNYNYNWTQATWQSPDPTNVYPLNLNMGGVRVVNTTTYNTTAAVTNFFPFPVLNPCFDYMGSGPGAGNLVMDQRTAPNTVTTLNLNRLHAAAFNPVRRLIGAPNATIAAAGGLEVYHMRFTFVNLEASARSLFKDCGVPLANSPIYLSLTTTPALNAQPAGTSVRIDVEGASAVLNPNTPLGSSTGMLSYAQGLAPNITTAQQVLHNPSQPSAPQLSGRRYFRTRTTLRGNHLTNQTPAFDSFSVLTTF
jgi:hypothetical protein